MVGCAVLTTFSIAVLAAPEADAQPSTRQATTSSVTQQLDHQTSRAAQWGLDETQWQRYQSLMQGVRGSVSPSTLSPIEVLGIHARSTDERQRFAEQWAAIMREDAERILAFQRAYDDAQRRLYPNGLLIDASVLSSNKTDQEALAKLAWQPTDRVLFFTDTQCPTCDALLERLVSQLTQFSGIDLYLIDVAPGEEPLIREWAVTKQINPQWVNEHKVTLNVDAGARDRIVAHTGQNSQALPVLVLRRGDQFTPLPAWRF